MESDHGNRSRSRVVYHPQGRQQGYGVPKYSPSFFDTNIENRRDDGWQEGVEARKFGRQIIHRNRELSSSYGQRRRCRSREAIRRPQMCLTNTTDEDGEYSDEEIRSARIELEALSLDHMEKPLNLKRQVTIEQSSSFVPTRNEPFPSNSLFSDFREENVSRNERLKLCYKEPQQATPYRFLRKELFSRVLRLIFVGVLYPVILLLVLICAFALIPTIGAVLKVIFSP